MKFDLLFLTQNSENMMRAGGYYSLFIIFIHAIKTNKIAESFSDLYMKFQQFLTQDSDWL